MSRALILAVVFWAASFAAQAQPVASDAEKAPTILACYKAGQTTIQEIRNCAGVWVTPKALLLCALQPTAEGQADHIACPFLPDTAQGRTILDISILECIKKSGADSGRALCLAAAVTADPNLPAAVKCLEDRGAAPLRLRS
jgi:hypothetical protein